MTDNEIIKEYEGLTPDQQLNLFRNMYYTDGSTTERGIIANAINDILPRYDRQEAEIERLRKQLSFAEDCIDKVDDALSRGSHNDYAEQAIEEYNNLVKEMVGADK